MSEQTDPQNTHEPAAPQGQTEQKERRTWRGSPARFIISREAWYGDPRRGVLPHEHVDEVCFGFWPDDPERPGQDGSAELTMVWYQLNEPQPCAKLEIFHDTWAALDGMPDVLAWMAGHRQDGASPSCRDFVEFLTGAGFEDVTDRDVPPNAAPLPEEE